MSPDDLSSLVKEKQTLSEIDRRIGIGANFLASLDYHTSKSAIDLNGKIVMDDTPTEKFIGSDLYFTNERNKLIDKFSEGNRICAEQYKILMG
jgi:hypothetical protein